MRPSSSSLVIARARISFSVKSLKRLGMGYLYNGRFRKRMAQKPPTSHPRMSHPSVFLCPDCLASTFVLPSLHVSHVILQYVFSIGFAARLNILFPTLVVFWER